MSRLHRSGLLAVAVLLVSLLAAACGGGSGVGPGTPMPDNGGDSGAPGNGSSEPWEANGTFTATFDGELFELTSYSPKDPSVLDQMQNGGAYSAFVPDGDGETFVTVHLRGYDNGPTKLLADLDIDLRMEIENDGSFELWRDTEGVPQMGVTGFGHWGESETAEFLEGPSVEWEEEGSRLRAKGKFKIEMVEAFVEDPDRTTLEVEFDVKKIWTTDP